MHIRRSFHVRLFEQSLKRIGAALKDRGEQWPAHTGPTTRPAELGAPVHIPPPTLDPLVARPPEPHSHLQRTTLLTRLAIELRAARGPAAIVHHMLIALGLHSDADAAIVLVGPDSAIELAMSNHAGPPQPMPLEQARQIVERGPAGWDWRDGDSVMLTSNTAGLGRAGVDDRAPSNIMALPLAHGPTTMGLLTLTQRSQGHFTSQDLLLFEAVAAQAGVALSAARWSAEDQHQRAHAPPVDQPSTLSRDPLHIIFDHLPDGLVLIDPAGRILIANEAFCEDVLGMLPRATIGRQYAAIIQELEQGAQITIEPHPGVPAARRARCAAGDGRQRWYDIDRYCLVTDNDEEHVIERWRDVTRQEEQRELTHDQQQTTIARMAANVVHEIGNPLQSVRSCIDLSREDRTLAAPTAEYLELASSELRRMSQILSQLRDLYRSPSNEANNE